MIAILTDIFLFPAANIPFYNAFDFNHRLTYFMHKPMIINRDLLENFTCKIQFVLLCTQNHYQSRLAFFFVQTR